MEYEVEFYTAAARSTTTTSTLSPAKSAAADWEVDDFDLYDDDRTQVSADNVITAEQAKAIAKAQAPSTATVVKCELDEDDGRWVYELELRDGRTEYECDINAVTGVILDWEVDHD